jgi:hypothetical protein
MYDFLGQFLYKPLVVRLTSRYSDYMVKVPQIKHFGNSLQQWEWKKDNERLINGLKEISKDK